MGSLNEMKILIEEWIHFKSFLVIFFTLHFSLLLWFHSGSFELDGYHNVDFYLAAMQLRCKWQFRQERQRMAHLSRLSFIPLSQPPRPPSLPHPSSLLSSLTFFFCNFFSVVFGSSLYFENPVPFLFFFFFFKHRHANRAAHTQFLFLQR